MHHSHIIVHEGNCGFVGDEFFWKLAIISSASSCLIPVIQYNYGMLSAKLQEDQLIALRAGDRDRLDVLRYILSQIKNKEIEKKDTLTDEEVLVILKNYCELKDSIESFEKGGRDDLVAGNKKQLEIISTYLPAELSDEELENEVKAIIAQNSDLAKQNSKALIGICVGRLKAKADPLV